VEDDVVEDIVDVVVVVSCVTQPHNRINAKMSEIIVFILEYGSSRI
jgi:hypothetical protein